MNQYDNAMDQWNYQQQLYNQEMDYWNQMNQWDQNNQAFQQWSTGADRMAPTKPRQAPTPVGPQPNKPRQIDFGAMFGGGFGGGGGWKATAPPGTGGGFNYGAFEGEGYQAPAGWVNKGIDTAGMVDPTAVINAAQPGIMEKMNNAFADAGNRFGSSGMVGTPYADALGNASRNAANDIAYITNQYTYQSALDQAQREQERAMAEYAADYNAWAQSGDWAHQGQIADMNQAFNAWAQMGDWQNQQSLQQGNLANQQWMAQNDWRFQDYMNQQNMQNNWMQQFLPMMMGMMGGY